MTILHLLIIMSYQILGRQPECQQLKQNEIKFEQIAKTQKYKL